MFLDCVPHLSINISDRPVAPCSIEFEFFFFFLPSHNMIVYVYVYVWVDVFVRSVCPRFFTEQTSVSVFPERSVT